MNYNKKLKSGLILEVFAVGLILVMAVFSFGQTNQTVDTTETTVQNQETETPALPFFTNYKEVKIGMKADEVKEKLGKAKVEDKDGFFYIFSDNEQAQIGLDEKKQVRVIVIMYSDKDGNAPKYKDIFGTEPQTAGENDSVYNLVQYPTAGYWVAYSRLGGDKPSVTVTIQKVQTIKQ